MSDKPTVEPLPPRDNLLDLDVYRQQRINEGDWLPAKDEHVKFFRSWKEKQKK